MKLLRIKRVKGRYGKRLKLINLWNGKIKHTYVHTATLLLSVHAMQYIKL